MADAKFDVVVVGTGPRRLRGRHPRRAARPDGRRRRGRPARRRLPELGLHPHQGAAPNAEVVQLFQPRRGVRHDRSGKSRSTTPRPCTRAAGGSPTGWPRASSSCSGRTRSRSSPGTGRSRAASAVEVKGAGRRADARGQAPSSWPPAPSRSRCPAWPSTRDGDLLQRGAVRNEARPKSLVVIGAGAVGVEFADVFAAYGVEVTVLEALPRVLPIEDEEISSAAGAPLRPPGHRHPHRAPR